MLDDLKHISILNEKLTLEPFEIEFHLHSPILGHPDCWLLLSIARRCWLYWWSWVPIVQSHALHRNIVTKFSVWRKRNALTVSRWSYIGPVFRWNCHFSLNVSTAEILKFIKMTNWTESFACNNLRFTIKWQVHEIKIPSHLNLLVVEGWCILW